MRHLSDEELLMAPDADRHLGECEACRGRKRELEDAVELVREHRETEEPVLTAGVARARLRAAMAEAAVAPAGGTLCWRPWHAAAVGALALVCTLAILSRAHRTYDVPSPRLTPGAARAMDRNALCNSTLPKNQVVPPDLRERVFQAYGIAHADPRKYEVDYLITPALGGADDIRNLWPQPYVSTVWNARVKDELEDRLREMVCGGRLDLAEAQRAISTDWIAAYKKYFGTAVPGR